MVHEVLERLEDMPTLLRQVVAAISEGDHRRKPAPDAFSLVEQVWHLADVEREGYGVRIRRLLAEDGPVLPDFPGGRMARERAYQEADLDLGLALFAHERARNLARLRALDSTALRRRGVQEGLGPVTIAAVADMMLAHDHSHVDELRALVTHLAPSSPLLATLSTRAATPIPRAPGGSSTPAAA